MRSSVEGQATVTIAVVGATAPPAAAIAAALGNLPEADSTAWRVVANAPGDAVGDAVGDAQIVVCDGPKSCQAAARSWPAASLVALVPARDGSSAVIDALGSGVTVCVRGDDLSLIAAYIRSVARRRGLTDGGPAR